MFQKWRSRKEYKIRGTQQTQVQLTGMAVYLISVFNIIKYKNLMQNKKYKCLIFNKFKKRTF